MSKRRSISCSDLSAIQFRPCRPGKSPTRFSPIPATSTDDAAQSRTERGGDRVDPSETRCDRGWPQPLDDTHIRGELDMVRETETFYASRKFNCTSDPRRGCSRLGSVSYSDQSNPANAPTWNLRARRSLSLVEAVRRSRRCLSYAWGIIRKRSGYGDGSLAFRQMPPMSCDMTTAQPSPPAAYRFSENRAPLM